MGNTYVQHNHLLNNHHFSIGRNTHKLKIYKLLEYHHNIHPQILVLFLLAYQQFHIILLLGVFFNFNYFRIAIFIYITICFYFIIFTKLSACCIIVKFFEAIEINYLKILYPFILSLIILKIL